MTSPDKPLVQSEPPQHILQQHGDSSWMQQQTNSRHRSASPHQQTIPNPASSPPPPGFGQGGDTGLSAPPPPGFVRDSSPSLITKTVGGGVTPMKSSSPACGQEQKKNSNATPVPSALSAEMAQMSGGRTSSFVNLAAALGTGLAESMDDATRGDWSLHDQHHQQQQQAPPVLQNQSSSGGSGSHSNNLGLHDLSFTRQSRHSAARLIGASPPKVVDPLGLDVGGSFLGGAPANLGGLTNDLHMPPSNQKTVGGLQPDGTFIPSSFRSGGASKDLQSPSAGREYSPLSMFGPNANRSRHLPGSRDIGVTVMEPGAEQLVRNRVTGADRDYNADSGGILATLMHDQQRQQTYCNDPHCHQQVQPQPQQHKYEQRQYDQNRHLVDRDTVEVERGMRGLWMDDSASMGDASRQSKNRQPQTHFMDRSVANSSRSGNSQSSRLVAEAEIRPFLWETRMPQRQGYQRSQGNVEPSRCLAILRAAHLQIPEVRTKCEAFGVLETFRSDFADRGIIFVSYYDVRSAQYAALDLEAVLKRRDNPISDSSHDVTVYYCVPLNSSTQTDESRIVLSDVPPFVDENSLLSMLSSYGAVRSLKQHGGYYGGSSFEVEFHNVQDSKQTLLELSSTQPWGPDVAIEVGMRPPIDRKRGREILAVIGRWRHGAKSSMSTASSTARTYEASGQMGRGAHLYRGAESSASSSPALAAPSDTTTQLVLGPDGRYSYMIVNNQSGLPPQGSSSEYNPPYGRPERLEQQRQQILHGPNGEIYITTMAVPAHQPPSPHASFRQGGSRSSRDYWPSSHQPPHHHMGSSHSHYSNAPYGDGRERLDRISGPYYSHHVISAHPDHHMGGHHPHHHHGSGASTTSGGDEKDNRHLVLDLENVENGRDARTSLMVRNIPNKYTQQMLLAEFTENGLGPGTIDFFYLPIDFKNRCNRGYAFINFVDFKDILPFHRRYFGKHWSTFNSDKICDITYARIQGKAAMLKRFENSALMEKDPEYRPLVFESHGPEKGKRIPFPEAAAALNSGRP